MGHLANYFYISGASYTTAGSTTDILNPTPPYKTSSAGPNYIDLLVNTQTNSLITPKSYAIFGSPVSWEVYNNPQTNDFTRQVDTFLHDLKKGDVLPKDIKPDETLYSLYFGINDIGQ